MHTFFLKFLFMVLFICRVGYAQDVQQMHESAKSLMKQGDFQNAIQVLNKALAIEPADISLSIDLSISYYYRNDLKKALEVINPVLERDDAVEESFQVAARTYNAMAQPKEAEKILKTGIKKIPGSGMLYNELGKIMWDQKEEDAIDIWKKGIEKDPAYSKNYYNAAKYYYSNSEKIWSILYGEIFLNLEPFSSNTPEIKDILLESYKKFFSDAPDDKNTDYNRLESEYLQSIRKQAAIAGTGIDPETLTMIRTRFIIDWFSDNKHPSYKLFDYQKLLLQEGLFEAYNQWIFGSAQNLSLFQNWINTHPDEYAALNAFQKSMVFKIAGDDLK